MQIIFLGAVAALALYSTIIERNLLIQKKVNIKLPSTKTKLRIAHFTDIHIGKFYSVKKLNKLVDKINKADADLVLLTGDLFDKVWLYNDNGEIDSILSKINAKIGKFAVYGNHDSCPNDRHTYSSVMNKSGFKLLKNSNIKFNIDNKILNLMGLDDFFQGKIDIQKTTQNLSNNEFNILMLHEPDLIEKFKDYKIDLALAGHSHGGQVFVPFYGTILNTGLAEMYDRNIYTVGSTKQTKLYVNSGIGSTGLPIRFFCLPNISILDINI